MPPDQIVCPLPPLPRPESLKETLMVILRLTAKKDLRKAAPFNTTHNERVLQYLTERDELEQSVEAKLFRRTSTRNTVIVFVVGQATVSAMQVHTLPAIGLCEPRGFIMANNVRPWMVASVGLQTSATMLSVRTREYRITIRTV